LLILKPGNAFLDAYILMTNYIAGVKVDFGLTYSSVLAKLDQLVASDGCHYIATVNPEFIMAAQEDAAFKAILNAADVSTPDGNGVLLAKYYLDRVADFKKDRFFSLRAFCYGVWLGVTAAVKKLPVGESVTGIDLMYEICQRAEQRNYSVFFLGSKAASVAAGNLKKQFPHLNILGTASRFNYGVIDDAKTQQFILDLQHVRNMDSVDIIFVAYGHGKQEKWIVRNNKAINAKVCIGVGGSFDVISGLKKRAPLLVRKVKLEWFYRLLQEPRRVRRILTSVFIFPIYIFLYSLKHK